MSDDHGTGPERDHGDNIAKTYQFPHSRVSPAGTPGGFKDLGITPLARQLALTTKQTNGHWCGRCQGIWFGYTLEAQCPACGNRKG